MPLGPYNQFLKETGSEELLLNLINQGSVRVLVDLKRLRPRPQYRLEVMAGLPLDSDVADVSTRYRFHMGLKLALQFSEKNNGAVLPIPDEGGSDELKRAVEDNFKLWWSGLASSKWNEAEARSYWWNAAKFSEDSLRSILLFEREVQGDGVGEVASMLTDFIVERGSDLALVDCSTCDRGPDGDELHAFRFQDLSGEDFVLAGLDDKGRLALSSTPVILNSQSMLIGDDQSEFELAEALESLRKAEEDDFNDAFEPLATLSDSEENMRRFKAENDKAHLFTQLDKEEFDRLDGASVKAAARVRELYPPPEDDGSDILEPDTSMQFEKPHQKATAARTKAKKLRQDVVRRLMGNNEKKSGQKTNTEVAEDIRQAIARDPQKWGMTKVPALRTVQNDITEVQKGRPK
jgi:hypothetical protein